MLGRKTWLWMVVATWSLAGCDCGPDEPVWSPRRTTWSSSFLPPDGRAGGQSLDGGRREARAHVVLGNGLEQRRSMSCGHAIAAHSFSDPAQYSTGVTGAQGTRNAMALINLGWAPSFLWDGCCPPREPSSTRFNTPTR